VAGGVSVERAQKGADRKNVSTSDPTEPAAAAAAAVDPTTEPPNQSSVYAHTLARSVLRYVRGAAAVVLYRVRVVHTV